MEKVKERIRRCAPFNTEVLISGESGTGKELVAKEIHRLSSRSEGPFVAINCGALPSHLLESELFGHVRGAFTGANQAKLGLLSYANRGTLFLDEIGEMDPSLQVKLLRVLQEREIRPVGGNQSTPIDVRIIAATNKNLINEIEEKRFRDDLYFRLNVIPIRIPPLRERQGDIQMLALHFLNHFSKKFNKKLQALSSGAMAELEAHLWPGNVRELKNVIERTCILAQDGTDIKATEIVFDPIVQSVLEERGELVSFPDGVSLREIEDRYIQHILEKTRGVKEAAAQVLGIDRKTLYRREQQQRSEAM